MNSFIVGSLCLVAGAVASIGARAQLSLSAQLRTRSEYRNGQGAPLPEGATPAFFTSQRSRLNLALIQHRVKLNMSLQDVRVWGQDASTINRFTLEENDALMLHEAWAEVLLTDTATKTKTVHLKLGRQELVYDDQRLLGNLDWLQQGRRHDAVVLMYDNKSWMLHAGGAFNQNREKGFRTTYSNTGAYPATTNGGAMYKSMALFYAKRKGKNGSGSFLFFGDGFNKYRYDTVGGVAQKSFSSGTWSRFTTGFYVTQTYGKATLTGSAYYQFGTNAFAQKVSAEMLTLQVQYPLGAMVIGPGIDYTSGSATKLGRSFDPLYGTPHKFWGLMDYFYAGSPFGRRGLIDAYLKNRYKAADNFFVTADLHHFLSAGGKRYGQEVDITGNYAITKDVTIEGGCAYFFTTSLLSSASVKNISQPKKGASWAYLMINIKPSFLIK